ncbi:MAG TPA: L,D-transpeptidase [Gaiellaceae bacterium]
MTKVLYGIGVAVLLGWCGSTVLLQRSHPPAIAPPAVAQHHCSTAVQPVGSAAVSYAAIVKRVAVAYRRPGGARISRFGRVNQSGFPTVFSVVGRRRTRDCATAWYRVQLPVRPNGTTGWVRAAAVQVAPVHTKILIQVHAKRLELFRDGCVVLRTPISTGSPETPTPTGRFYVKERLVPTNASGPWGPAALGISAFSPVLKSWAQGGPVGIHGTNDPSAIGQAVSHGCIRLDNAQMRRLFALTLAGTPVIIVA